MGQVREAYQSILDRVEEACCVALPFTKDQSNRIAQLIKEQWGDLPDYPFAKLPTYGAFRHPNNNKWYALVSQIPRDKLDGSGSQEQLEIVNLKVDGREIAELLSQSGIFLPTICRRRPGCRSCWMIRWRTRRCLPSLRKVVIWWDRNPTRRRKGLITGLFQPIQRSMILILSLRKIR